MGDLSKLAADFDAALKHCHEAEEISYADPTRIPMSQDAFEAQEAADDAATMLAAEIYDRKADAAWIDGRLYVVTHPPDDVPAHADWSRDEIVVVLKGRIHGEP